MYPGNRISTDYYFLKIDLRGNHFLKKKNRLPHGCAAAAAPLPPQAGAPGSTAASAAEQVAIVAQQLRGGAAIPAALFDARVRGVN